jgi:hypothetical protein
MNLLPKIFFFLSVFIFLTGCKTPYKFGVSTEPDEFIYSPIIHLVNNNPVLYSSEFDIMKYHFSGLIAFRQMPEENEIRIAFLTETGLKLLEYNYKHGEVDNTFCIPIADKKRIKKLIGNFLLLLLETPDCTNLCIENIDGKSTYYCRNNSTKHKAEIIENLKTNACFSKRSNSACGTYTESEELPDKIEVKMSHGKIRIFLKRIDNAFK